MSGPKSHSSAKSSRAGTQTQVVRLQSACLDQGHFHQEEGPPELGLKEDLELAEEEEGVGKGGLARQESACAKASCLAREGWSSS